MVCWPKNSKPSHPSVYSSKNINHNQHLLDTYNKANNIEPKQSYHHKISKTQSVSSITIPEVAQTNQNKAQGLPKVSIITEFFPPDYAATGQLIEELVKQLEKLGLTIEVFTGQPSYAFSKAKAPSVEQLGDIRIQRSRSTQAWSGRIRGKAVSGILFTVCAFLHLVKNYRKHNVYLITSAPPFLSVAAYLAHLCLRISYVCLIYDLYPDIAIALKIIPKNHWLAGFWREINKMIWRKCKEIIVLSPNMKEKVTAICPEVADKISVIHSWGDPDLIVPISKEKNWFAQKHNLVNKFTVLYSGNMGRCHDTNTVLETAKQLRNEPIQFVCIGSGAKRKEFEEEVNKAGLTNNFLFLPYQDKEVLPYSLTACDLSLVSVESGMESLVAPSKLYPALAAARPIAVICPKYSYLRELITDGKCGITVENGDSFALAEFIRLLSSNHKLAELMGKASRQYLQSNFTPQIIAKEYFSVLENSSSK